MKFFKLAGCVRSVCWASLLVACSAVAGIQPVDLGCESKPNPIGLSETSPRLSWQDVATSPGERGQNQTAYQIQVASSLQLLTNSQGDLWDTGQVMTNQTSQIAYNGSALTTDQVCYWHVQVWDKNGAASGWSSPASWSMGMLLTNKPVATAQITWVAQGTFTDNSVLALAGPASNEVYGVDFGGSGFRTTANGYTFQDNVASGNMSIAGTPLNYASYLTGGATTGDAALDSMLTHGAYGATANSATLKNLTIGQTYKVLALLADTRGGSPGGTFFTINDSLADSPSQAYAFPNGGPAVGGYILGTFTASATTQTFTVKNGPNPNTQYNVVLVEKGSGTVVPPTTNVLQSQWTGQWIGRDDGPMWTAGSTFSQAKWVWFPEGTPNVDAPAGTRWFRKVFTVPTGVSVTKAIASMTADNSFSLYVNGQLALAGDNWQQLNQTDITSFLVSGTNVLAVAAVNGPGASPNPAGLIGAFDLTFSNSQTNSFQTDGAWITTNQLVANWNQTNFVPSGWAAAQVLGSYGISPWGSTASKTYLAATMVRKDFTVAQLPARAVLYVTGQGLVEPHLNGAKVGNDYFVPGWTDYHLRLYYRAYDVTALLQPGSNTVGAILGDGWYRGNCAFDGQNFYGTKTRLLAELHLSYTNGPTQIITSDASWQAGFGPIRQCDNQAGEAYDARLELPGWDSPGFSNGSWTAVTTGAEISPTIQAHPAEPVQTNQTFVPVSITQPQAGLYVMNFGQNISGWARLTVSNQPPGRTLIMRFGEWLNPDGTVFRDNLRSAAATDTYICKGGASETWEPRFTYHGFQYMEVEGLDQPPTTNTFTAINVRSGLTDSGLFQCSNDLINHIYSNMLWSVRDNYFEVPTDCDQRDERAGWCDGIEVMGTGMFNLQTESFFNKWYQDIVDTKARATTSDFGQQAPLVGDFGFSAGWQDCVVFVPYGLYQTYGDLRPAQRFYTTMASHMDYYAAHSTSFIGPNSGYGDWVAVDGSTPLNLISTAFYARCAKMMAEMAQALGKTSDAVAYGTLFTNISAAFRSQFVAGDGTVGSGSEGGYALALAFNLLTPAQRAMATNKLAAAVSAQSGHPSTGMVTTHLLLPALTSIGRSDLAYQMLAKTDYPSWGYEVNLGATTIFELWNSVNADGTVNTSQDGMNSLNHANFGTCTEWFYRGILGIDLLAPGFSKILINPQAGGGLTWAQGSYDSIQGRITSAWQFTNNTFTLNVTIPANTTGEIHVPTTNAAAITESGVSAASSPGVTYLGVSNGAAIYNVGSGNYGFSSAYSIPAPVVSPIIITATNQTGSGSGTFFPSWTVVTNGSLITERPPSAATGNFSEEVGGRDVNSLTAGGSLGISSITATVGSDSGNPTTSTNYVTCGNGTGPDGSSAGSTVIYSLPAATYGYDLTNITVYGGWSNNGRDQQAYTVYYSTVSSPASYLSLASVNFNPSIANNVPDATRVTLTSAFGVMANNVANLKFDFTTPASENGYCGYAAIAVFGTASIAPAVPTNLSATFLAGQGGFMINMASLAVGRNYQLQSTTNLTSHFWFTETNFVAAQTTAAWTNSTLNDSQKFYRVLGN
jgi:alpha-L-rhamnosidase